MIESLDLTSRIQLPRRGYGMYHETNFYLLHEKVHPVLIALRIPPPVLMNLLSGGVYLQHLGRIVIRRQA